MIKLVPIIILSIMLISCGKKCDTIGSLRCKGNKVEVCNSSKKWKTSRDCSDFANTKCGELQGTKTCVKRGK